MNKAASNILLKFQMVFFLFVPGEIFYTDVLAEFSVFKLFYFFRVDLVDLDGMAPMDRKATRFVCNSL